jgi:DNA-binding NarL/FixJ family response regulator
MSSIQEFKMSAAQEDFPLLPKKETDLERGTRPALHVLGALPSSFITLEFRPIVAADTRRDIFALVEDWPADQPNPLDKLTAKELDTAALISLGYKNKPIAEGQIVTEQTVKFHASNILNKLNLYNRTQLGVVARRAGIFTRIIDRSNLDLRQPQAPIASSAALKREQFYESGVAADRFTKREREIVDLVVDEGLSNAEIARRLWVTDQTVKFHLSNSYKKLGVGAGIDRSRASYVASFARVGIGVNPKVPSIKPDKGVDSSRPEVAPENSQQAYFRRFIGKKIVQSLAGLEVTHGLTNLNKLRSKSVTIKRSNYEILQDMGVITKDMDEGAWIDLPAVLLASLLGPNHVGVVVGNPKTRKIAIDLAHDMSRDFIDTHSRRAYY